MSATPKRLTPAQRRILLAACREHGTTRNAIARPAIERLEAAGLVRFVCMVRPDALRGRHTLAYQVFATAAGQAAAALLACAGD